MKQLHIRAVIGTALIAALASCLPVAEVDDLDNWGSPQTRTVTIDVVAGETIYLVKYNPSSREVPAQYTGSVRSVSPAALPTPSRQQAGGGGQSTAPGFETLVTHHKAAMEFNANPPEFTPVPRRMARAAPPAEGATRQFWVQNGPYDNSPWIQIPATLKKNGTKCRIWVADSNDDNSSSQTNDNKITTEQARMLAEKFDLIYPKETAFFGYELGGGLISGQTGYGGIDGDPLIQILVYDIDSDYQATQDGGTLGFFWGKDEYPQTVWTNAGYSLKSNEAEIFYVDAHFLDKNPASMYSTLIHEFQHMIQFNEKYIKRGLNSETWYNEMLSMLAEDMLAPDVDVPATNPGHPINVRIPFFNTYYWYSGVTDWLGGNGVILSYADAYAFGAYLARNYGGAKLVKTMATHNAVNVASVDAALRSTAGITFEKALEKFPETLLHTSEATYIDGILTNGLATYNHAATGSTWSLAGYDFAAFNIAGIPHVNPQNWSGDPLPQGTPANGPGPVIWSVQQTEIRPYGIDIQKYGTVSGAGQASITATSYPGSPVKMYLLCKKSDGTVVRHDF
jgi:trehalose utilization protein